MEILLIVIFDLLVTGIVAYVAYRTGKITTRSQRVKDFPNKDRAVNVGFGKATETGYNYRRVCRDADHDLYYSGWMDCYDWMAEEYLNEEK
jgi:hypothetical protein